MSTDKENMIEIDEQYTYLGEHGIIVDTGDPQNISEPITYSKSPRTKSESGSKVSFWGEENDFPQKVIEAIEQSTELGPLLDWKARALQGRELRAFKTVGWDPKKKSMIYEYVDDAEINDFLSHRITKRYLREASIDFFYFWNVFPDLIKSVDGERIAYIGTQDASWCRWGEMNAKGNIEKCFISADWPNAKSDDKEVIKLDVIDPYDYSVVDTVKENKNLKRFIYPVSYPSPGKAFYQLAPWNGFLTSKWHKIAKEIPESKERKMSLMLSAKYILQIPVNYWPAVYKDWAKKKPEEQTKIKRDKVKEINKDLTGVSNTGKTILTEVGYDENGREIPSWKIVPIESAFKDEKELEDSREASQHLMRALGVDSTLVGDSPGKSMGAGSGSDKRVAFNIYVALQQPYRDVILEPFYFIADYNGWSKRHPGLVFKMVEIELETLDKSHSTSVETTN